METPKTNREKPFSHIHTVFHKHKFTGLALMGVALVLYLATVSAATITTATGGSSISADTNGATGTGTYTTLTGPTIAEASGREFNVTAGQTIVLNAPTGFAFNTGATVSAAITLDSGGACFSFSSNTVTPTASTITYTFAGKDSTGSTKCHVTFSNIQVRPTAGTPLATGNITNSGNATGVPNPGNYGTLTEVAGTSTKLAFSTQPSATGTTNTNFGTPPVVDIQDQFGNRTGGTNSISMTARTGATTCADGSLGSGAITSTPTAAGAAATAGRLTYTAMQYSTAQTIKLCAAASGLTSALSSAVAVSAAAPVVTSVSTTTADGSYNAGNTVHITVTFDNSVTVTGTPRIQFETGATDHYADYVSGSPGTVLTFDYVVTAGDTSSDLDYLSTGALTLNGGTINDTSSGSPATLTLPAVGTFAAAHAIVIDTTAPNAATALGWSQTSPHNSTLVTAAWTKSNSADLGNQKIQFYSDATCTVASGSLIDLASNSLQTRAFTGLDASTYTYKITSIDNATNETVSGCSSSMLLDTSAPNTATALGWAQTSPHNTTSVTASWTKSDSADLANQKIQFYSDAACTVTSGSLIDLASNSVQTRAFTGVNGTTYTFKVTSIDNAANETVSGCSSSMLIDTAAPTVTNVTSTASNGTYGTSAVIPITIQFSEPVIVTGTPRLTLAIPGPGPYVDYTSGSGTNTLTFDYTVQAGESSADLDYQNTSALNLNGGTITDAATNSATLTLPTPGGAGSLGGNKNIVIDTTAVTVTLTSTIVGTSTNVSPIPMTATFSEDVTGFIDTDVTVTNAASPVTNFVAVDGSHYTFDVTPSAQGAVTVDVLAGVAQNGTLIPNLAAPTFNMTYDTVAPSILAANVQDTNADGKMDRMVLTFDEALADVPADSNGFDVSSSADHGLCNSEMDDPNGTTTLTINFSCANVDTAIGDLTLSLTTNPGIKDAAGNQVASVVLDASSVPPLTDNAQPIVTGTTPAAGALAAQYNGSVVVNFSEPMNTGSFSISDDNSNSYNAPAWSNGDKTVTVSHADWTINVPATVTVDGSDTTGHSINGAGTFSWGFTTGNNLHQGHIDIPTAVVVTDSGTDLSNGVSTAAGGNILIDNVLQPLNNVTDGDLAGDDLSVSHVVGDVSVTPTQALTLNSTGDINLTNSGISNVATTIPNNTTVYGCTAWDGILTLKPGSNSGNAPSGFSVGNSTYEIGSSSCPLLLSQPVTLTITGLTGPVGYKPAGSTNWFSVPGCSGTYASPTPPPAPTPFQECAISNGADTKIVTYHFTTFGGLVTSSGSTGSSSGDVGGGGFYPTSFTEIPSQTQEQTTRSVGEVGQLHGAAEKPCERTAASNVPFTDIANSPDKASIEDLYRSCVINGKTADLFAPKDTVTKGEMAKMLITKFKLGVGPFENLYSDVSEQNPFASYLYQAVRLGIINVQSANHLDQVLLRPDASLTRAEAMYMALKAKGVNLYVYNKKAQFSDISPEDWFYKTAAYAQNEKLLDETSIHFDRQGKVSKFYRLPRLLGLNNVGEDVRQLKLIMSQMDYFSGAVNTTYDQDLANAVGKYQKSKHLAPTGSMGAVTRTRILGEYLNPKVTSFFRPYSPITRGEAAKLIDLVFKLNTNVQTGEVLGVTYSRFDNIIFTIKAYLSAMADYIQNYN